MPEKEWIIDVIADLFKFAGSNEMHETAKHLKQVQEVARTELKSPAPKATPKRGDNFALFSDFDNPHA